MVLLKNNFNKKYKKLSETLTENTHMNWFKNVFIKGLCSFIDKQADLKTFKLWATVLRCAQIL